MARYSDKIAVCIPAYNAGLYLSSTLESIVKQSHKNLEIIVSDNASTDNTRQIVEVFMRTDSRIRYLNSTQNVGYVKNIEKTVGASYCDFVAIFHADDIYENSIIEREHEVLRNRNDVSAVFTKYRRFHGEYRKTSTEYKEAWEDRLPYDSRVDAYYGNLSEYVPILLEIGNPFCCPSFMTRRNDYFFMGGFSDKYPSNEDLELWLKYLLNKRKLAIVSKTLVNYRLSPGQGSALWENRHELPVYYTVIDEMVMPSVEGLLSKEIYEQRKAASWIDLASRVSVYDSKYRQFMKKSKRVHYFPIYSEKGLIQRFPVIYVRLRRIYSYTKQSLRSRFPVSYKYLKLLFRFLSLRFSQLVA